MELNKGCEEFKGYALVSEMPEGVKQHFWDYLGVLEKRLDVYYKDMRRNQAPENLDSACADFTNFLKTIPAMANARLYQKQKKCVGELVNHYRESGRKTPGKLLRELAKNFASEYR
jgi:hypothetical protein